MKLSIFWFLENKKNYLEKNYGFKDAIGQYQRADLRNSQSIIHGRIIDKDWQLISLFKNICHSAIILILWGEIKKHDLEYLNLFL